MRLRLLMVLCAGLFACDKSNPNNNNNTDGGSDGGGGGNFSVISRQETLAVGSTQCANGGVLVHVGLDDGAGGGVARDGILQDGEIDSSTPICGVGVTYNTVVKATPLVLGDLVCMFGGSKLEYGLDNGENGGTANNGILEDGERDGFVNACLPAPSDLLVETTDLYPGDTTCFHGGVIVRSGLDDGRDGGTKGNGLLETGEVTLNQTRCNPSPTDKFPAPTGANGTGAIDGRGGNGAGTGSGSNTAGGSGGSFFGVNIPGPLAGSVEIHANGSVTPNAATSTATYTAGGSGSELTITDTQTAPTMSALQSDADMIYLFKPEPNTDLGTQQAQGIYKGMTLITSIHVTPTGTLRLKDSFVSGAARAWVSGDIRNEGTIIGVGSGDEPTTLILESHHVINEASGIIGQPGAAVALFASQGTGGEIVNRGEITARGPDAVGASSDVPGRTITLVGEAGITNTSSGKIIARGGNDDATGIGSRKGGIIGALAFRGSFKNGGTIDLSGGKGASGGEAGKAVLIAGPFMTNMPGVGTYLPQYPDADPDIMNGGTGIFDFDQSGTIKADGGDALGTAFNGGTGGEIYVLAHGGSIRGNNAITAVGGASTSNGGSSVGGNGGRITVHAATLVTPSGDLQIPAEISLTGTYNYRGGSASAATGFQRGGSGGTMAVVLDADIGGLGEGAEGIIEWNAQQNYDHSKIIASTAKPRLQLLGIPNVHLQGANAAGSIPGTGGTFYGVALTCGGECYYPRVDSHYVVTNTAVNLSGGNGAFNYDGGNGGGMFLAEIGNNNRIPAVIEASQIDARGSINLKGGDMTGSAGSTGGGLFLQATSGDALIEASPILNGGASTTSAGGTGGTINIFAFQTTINGDVNNSGGVGGGTTGNAQAGGMNVEGYRLAMTGDLTSTGSSSATNFRLADSITITGAINFSSAGFNGSGMANAGSITLNATNISTSGPITGNGANTAGAATLGGNGGYISGRGTWTNTGAVTMNGGNATSATSANGGSGGGIEFSGKISGGTFTFNGGSATATGATTDAATGGNGGGIALSTGKEPAFELAATATMNGGSATVTSATAPSQGGYGGGLYLGSNKGSVTANGGPASGGLTATGGTGGECTLNTNSANISLVGGNATGGVTSTGGTGGHAGEVLANTACINVNGGTPSGAAGTPPTENVCL